MSVESYRESPGKFDSRTLNRKTSGKAKWVQSQWGQKRTMYFSKRNVGVCVIEGCQGIMVAR